MSKTTTKNKNLWSDDKLQLEYIGVYKELTEKVYDKNEKTRSFDRVLK